MWGLVPLNSCVVFKGHLSSDLKDLQKRILNLTEILLPSAKEQLSLLESRQLNKNSILVNYTCTTITEAISLRIHDKS